MAHELAEGRDRSRTGAGKPSLSLFILTFNEQIHIARALASAARITDRLFVVDAHSTDATVRLAEAAGAQVFTNRFTTHAAQVAWALEHLPFQTDWIMRLDADELIEDDLAERIRRELPLLSSDVTGIVLKRKHIFMGRWIRHGDRYPIELLRIWRRGQAVVEPRLVDEHMFVRDGRVMPLDGGFADCNLNDLSFFTAKHNLYATREAVEILDRRYRFLGPGSDAGGQGSAQADRKRLLRGAYQRVPFWAAAPAYFLYRYVLRLGFLDGVEGLIYHGLQGFWYRFLVGAKVRELEMAVAGLSRPEDLRQRLSVLTGLDLMAHAAAERPRQGR